MESKICEYVQRRLSEIAIAEQMASNQSSSSSSSSPPSSSFKVNSSKDAPSIDTETIAGKREQRLERAHEVLSLR